MSKLGLAVLLGALLAVLYPVQEVRESEAWLRPSPKPAEGSLEVPEERLQFTREDYEGKSLKYDDERPESYKLEMRRRHDYRLYYHYNPRIPHFCCGQDIFPECLRHYSWMSCPACVEVARYRF